MHPVALQLAETIAEATDVDVEEILGRRRLKGIVQARQQLFVDLWREGFSIADVGRMLDRDHTTVMYGMRKVLGASYKAEIAARYPFPGFKQEKRRR